MQNPSPATPASGHKSWLGARLSPQGREAVFPLPTHWAGVGLGRGALLSTQGWLAAQLLPQAPGRHSGASPGCWPQLCRQAPSFQHQTAHVFSVLSQHNLEFSVKQYTYSTFATGFLNICTYPKTPDSVTCLFTHLKLQCRVLLMSMLNYRGDGWSPKFCATEYPLKLPFSLSKNSLDTFLLWDWPTNGSLSIDINGHWICSPVSLKKNTS